MRDVRGAQVVESFRHSIQNASSGASSRDFGAFLAPTYVQWEDRIADIQ
jgi:hypothetical protein